MLKPGLNRLAYFSLHRLIGSRIRDYYREFLGIEKQTAAQIRELQAERLEKLLLHASRNIPFYRERVEARNGLGLDDFPVVKKEDVRANFEKLMSAEIREEYRSGRKRRRYSWIAVQTGGSTGMPTTVIHDRDGRDFGRAARLYNQYLCGFPLGTPYLKLWGSMREINDAKGSFAQRLASRLAGETIFNAFRMEDAEIEAYINLINRSCADHLMAYSDAAHRVAQYILKHGRKVRPLKSVMACAATLTEDMRYTISSGFGGARVHNTYGSRDCGSMACECGRGAFHVFENRVVLEAGPTGAGHAALILVTLLENYGFPLIRYEIGDMGTYSKEACDCGIPTRILSGVEGRDIEFLFTTAGGYISPIYFRHLIGVMHNPGVIRQFQIVQHAMDRVELKLVAEPGAADRLLQDSVAKIRRDLVAVLGQPMTLKIEIVESIPASGSGKFIFALNRVKTPPLTSTLAQ